MILLGWNNHKFCKFFRVRLGRTTKYRLVIIHKDEPGMIGNIASEIAQKKLNITDYD